MGPITETKISNLTKPIDPNLDIETIDQIEQRKEYRLDTFLATPTP